MPRRVHSRRNDFTWSISGVQNPEQDDNNNGVPNKWDLDERTGYLANTYSPAFLEQVKGPDGQPIVDGRGYPTVQAIDTNELDFSGFLLNVGLRFYLF